ncbi:unnamed protein product [Urochloa humidicola]
MSYLTLSVILRCFTLLFILSLAAGADNSTTGSGQIRLDCGASSPPSTDADGRTWDSDTGSEGIAATASYADPTLPSPIPYMTARIFGNNYTYSFPISPGRMFVRLYFYPSTYGDYFGPGNAYFGVTAGNLTLLDNFNASQTALARNDAAFVLEYSINITAGKLDLTFSPCLHPHTRMALIMRSSMG